MDASTIQYAIVSSSDILIYDSNRRTTGSAIETYDLLLKLAEDI